MSDGSNHNVKILHEPLRNIGAQDILQVGGKLYDGTLRKRSQLDKLLGSTRWKQRFVVISQGCVYCFKSEYASRPLTAFSLTVYDSAVETEMHGVLNCFEIRHETKDKTPHYFAAETDDKRKAWLGYLNDAIAQAHTFSGEKLSADSDEGIAGCKYKPVNRRSNVPLPPLPTASPSASSARAPLAKASPKSEYDLESEEDDDPYDKVPEQEAPAKPSVTSPTRSGATLPGGVPLLPTTAGLQELSRKRPQTVSKRPPQALPGTYQETHIATDTIGRRTLSLAEPSATPNYINDTVKIDQNIL
ncbi:SH3 domain-binding protein 2-like [Dreissena polymorpha]|uniref:SH3 domain-binding protein 2-like n=1 Tax=Dreissena polymorpha TaxID=45954 RepID=UPI002263D71A|nr:SH3 domain-binding protein 2-like [Dreissena polymorpha]